MIDARQIELQKWLSQELQTTDFSVLPLANDASFRRYFRVKQGNNSFVAMDAPPDKEPCDTFLKIAKLFKGMDLSVPEIFKADASQGFILLSDFGDALYLKVLNKQNAEALYAAAIQKIPVIQSYDKNKNVAELPAFDEKWMRQELENFSTWFLAKFLNWPMSAHEEKALQNTYKILIASATEQPQYAIHRDYHSRNLMALPNQEVGILDFQDAMIGPVTYDLVSLIRDCYIAWPDARVTSWAKNYYESAKEKQLLSKTISFEAFLQWLDRMGTQRHLKAAFIFARKFLRDQNPHYLDDIPRTLNYVVKATENDAELKWLHDRLTTDWLPAFHQKRVAS